MATYSKVELANIFSPTNWIGSRFESTSAKSLVDGLSTVAVRRSKSLSGH